MNDKIVIGCGFGDEGKGKVVSYLCSCSTNPLVIRFSGGHQAGHHVVLHDGREHVFSNFGSGTLQGAPTYWMPHCTVYPTAILNEYYDLKNKFNIKPMIFIHRKCPITTPYEIYENGFDENKNKHGTCGVGFGRTLQREEDHYSLLFEDIFYPDVLNMKLKLIQKYYQKTLPNNFEFIRDCIELSRAEWAVIVDKLPWGEYDYIYEGSQGLLLDQNYGFFPHVTRSNTGTKNIYFEHKEVYLVTRAYQTRHGNGPIGHTNLKYNIKNNPYEKNNNRSIQGEFRISPLSFELLKYAIRKDDGLRDNKNLNLVVTCLDLIQPSMAFQILEEISSWKMFKKIYTSFAPFPSAMSKWGL